MRAMMLSMLACERQCWPTITFSSVVISLNSRMFWKVRAMPSFVTLEGSMPAMSLVRGSGWTPTSVRRRR